MHYHVEWCVLVVYLLLCASWGDEGVCNVDGSSFCWDGVCEVENGDDVYGFVEIGFGDEGVYHLFDSFVCWGFFGVGVGVNGYFDDHALALFCAVVVEDSAFGDESCLDFEVVVEAYVSFFCCFTYYVYVCGWGCGDGVVGMWGLGYVGCL